jgi:hypothetical protein
MLFQGLVLEFRIITHMSDGRAGVMPDSEDGASWSVTCTEVVDELAELVARMASLVSRNKCDGIMNTRSYCD